MKSILLTVVFVLSAVSAFAQNPCTTPSTNAIVTTAPARLFAELSDLTATLPDGTAVNVDYQYGAWNAGQDVNAVPPAQGPSTLPKTAFAPVAGFPGCYELTGGLPGLIPSQTRMVVALRSRGQPNASVPISPWSAPSNSFSLASTPVNPAVPGQVRIRP